MLHLNLWQLYIYLRSNRSKHFLFKDLHDKWVRFMISTLYYVSTTSIAVCIISYQAKKILRGICLNQKSFASIGGDIRRHIFSLKEIKWGLRAHTCFQLATVIILLFVDMKIIKSPRTVMILWSFSVVVLLSFRDIFLPWRIFWYRDYYLFLWIKPVERKSTPFYVRKPELIPRQK